jgi:hypothetical protein
VANTKHISEVNCLFLASEIMSLIVKIAWECRVSGVGLALHYTAQLISTTRKKSLLWKNKKTELKIKKILLELRPQLQKKMIVFNKGKEFLIFDFLDAGLSHITAEQAMYVERNT